MIDLPRPQKNDIIKLVGRMEERHRDAHNDIRYRRAMRWMKHPVRFGTDEKGNLKGIPPAYSGTTVEYRSPRLNYESQQAKALLLSNDPTLMIRAPSADDQPKVSGCERFLAAAYTRTEERTHAHEKLVDCQVTMYAGILKTFMLPTPYKGMPERDKDEELDTWNKRTETWKKENCDIFDVFEYTYVTPDTFYYLEDSKGLACGMEIKKVNELELMEEFGLYRQKDGTYLKTQQGVPASGDMVDPVRDVEVIEFWNRQWRCIITRNGAKTTDVDTWEHGFGRVPYFIFGAFETGETDPALQHIPLLWPLYPEVESYNRLLTLRGSVAYFTGFPFYWIFSPTDADLVIEDSTGKPMSFKIEPGLARQLNPGQEWRQLQLISGFDLQKALEDTDERIKEYALPPVASGKAPASESPAWGTQLLRRYLVSLLDPLVRGRAMGTAEYMRFWLECIKKRIGQTVYANEETLDAKGNVIGKEPISIKPDDIISLDLSVSISPNLQNERISQEAHGAGLVAQGLRSRMTFMEQDSGVQAPEDELRKIDIDQAAAALWEAVYLPALVAWAQQVGGAEAVLEGDMNAEQASGMMQDTRAGVGKGSPGLEREPGLGMAPAIPQDASSTYSPTEG